MAALVLENLGLDETTLGEYEIPMPAIFFDEQSAYANALKRKVRQMLADKAQFRLYQTFIRTEVPERTMFPDYLLSEKTMEERAFQDFGYWHLKYFPDDPLELTRQVLGRYAERMKDILELIDAGENPFASLSLKGGGRQNGTSIDQWPRLKQRPLFSIPDGDMSIIATEGGLVYLPSDEERKQPFAVLDIIPRRPEQLAMLLGVPVSEMDWRLQFRNFKNIDTPTPKGVGLPGGFRSSQQRPAAQHQEPVQRMPLEHPPDFQRQKNVQEASAQAGRSDPLTIPAAPLSLGRAGLLFAFRSMVRGFAKNMKIFKKIICCYFKSRVFFQKQAAGVAGSEEESMERAYKFRLYPTREQEELIQKTFGCVRFVYNHFLDERIVAHQTEGKTLSFFEQSKSLTALKKELPWLQEPDKAALQNALRNLETAYRNFFRSLKTREHVGYPKFRSKKNRHQSYRSQNNGGNVRLADKAIRLPKLGFVKCRISKKVEGRILSAAVSQTPSGKYFVSLCCTDVEIEPLPATGKNIGIDMGVRHTFTDSDGTAIPAPKFYAQSMKQLAKLQRQLSRKQKGSHRCEKARIKVARLQEHIANQRNDFLQKLTTGLVRQYDVICFETLKPSELIRKNQAEVVAKKRRNLDRAQYDAAWGDFGRMLQYKAEWYGRKVVRVPEDYPSTQTCRCCGERTKFGVEVRRWQCPSCGAEHDRDINAAINILNEGLRLLA